MNVEYICDFKIIIINKALFKEVLHAETQYFVTIYPYLTHQQARGKALKAIGIDDVTGQVANISQLFPLTYKRRIKKPKEKWNRLYIQKLFTPVIFLARKLLCLKNNSSSFSSLESAENNICPPSFSSSSDINSLNPTHGNKSNALQNKKAVDVPRSIKDKLSRNTPAVDSIRKISSGKGSINSKGRGKLNELQLKNTGSKNVNKLSESKALILWPFTSQNVNKKQRDENEINSKIYSLDNTPQESSILTVHKSKYSSQIANHFDSTNSRKPKANSLKQASSLKENQDPPGLVTLDMSNDCQKTDGSNMAKDKGFLTEFFTPRIKKRLFPDALVPVIIHQDFKKGLQSSINSRS